MAMNKRKTTTAVVAGVAAAALLLGGTFAWISISQEAKNESAGVVNVGGRLHDDFNGSNKDIYVENFTDPLDGGQPIYARIRLDEYMEIGSEAGLTDTTGAYVPGRNATPVVAGTDINNVATWTPHVPTTDCLDCETGETCLIHDHWTWAMGGETVFMPTFNRDKDSLKADVNGSYEGTTIGDTTHYDDYMEYTTDTAGKHFIVGTDTYPELQKVYQKTDTELYDDDTDPDDNGGYREVLNQTHTAKKTANATVILMTDWQKLDPADQVGPYWVYDNTTGGNGWAYWAMPIMPGEATGLLLDGIEMTKNPGDKCYYAINVVAQFATAGDWQPFADEGGSALTTAAEGLLNQAVANVPTITVTNVNKITTAKPGQEVEFAANVSVNGATTYAASDFEWSVLGDDMLPTSTNSTITDGILKVDAQEMNSALTVVAKSKDPKYAGAVGVAAVAVSWDIVTTNDLTAPAYVVLTQNGTDASTGDPTYTMSFVRTNDTIVAGSTHHGVPIAQTFDGFETVTDEFFVSNGNPSPWHDERLSITYANIENTMKPNCTAEWFYDFQNLETIDGLHNINTSETTNIRSMFHRASSLTKLEGISHWDLSSMEMISWAFAEMPNLVELDLSGWDTSGVLYMHGPFNLSTSLTTIKGIENWDTGSATNMKNFFAGTKVTSLDLREWDMSQVQGIDNMFKGCTALEELQISGWDVSQVTNMYHLFEDCTAIEEIDVSGWQTNSINEMTGIFYNCTALTTIKGLSDWDTTTADSMVGIFNGCSVLNDIGDISGWNTANATDMSRMFYNCSALTFNCSNWNVANVTTHDDFNTGAPGVQAPTWVN